ncbi:hypothetical protein [Lapidilactobacillus luobeiensis]|uniref:hypothetical protein n=1 Tax=Lapidilactobacillus luobeiensis TaxID=2950371 RepID=UPI0021C37D60|nr:hypothetical protein [Lapidilactobacillus luobeiensis]
MAEVVVGLFALMTLVVFLLTKLDWRSRRRSFEIGAIGYIMLGLVLFAILVFFAPVAKQHLIAVDFGLLLIGTWRCLHDQQR